MSQEQREDLSPDERQQVVDVQNLIVALEKFTRAQKLYLANNKILIQHQQNVSQLFQKAFSHGPAFQLKVTPFDFTFLGVSVYHNDNKKESFAFRLYNEGMRGIRFAEGVSGEEIMDFVMLLNSVIYEAETGSNSPMLWEKEFEHITYEIAEYIIDDPGYDVDQKMDEILDPNMAHYTGPTAPIGPPEDIEEEIEVGELLEQNHFKSVVKNVCVLEKHEFEQIQREIVNGERHERLMLDLFDILLTLILEETEPQELEKLYKVLLDTIDATVLHGELHITSQLLWALRGLLEGGEGDFALRHPDRLLHILDSLGTKDRIGRYLQSLNLGFQGSVKDIVNFFSTLPKRAFPIMLANIHIVGSPQLRKEICIAISQLYDNNVQTFSKAFKVIKRSSHLLDVLFILSHTRDTRAIPYMEPLFFHENRNVKLTAINTLRDLGVRDGKNFLMQLMEDPDSEIRIHAIRALAGSDDVNIGRLLLERIKGNDILSLPVQEKRAYFYGAAKLLHDEYVPLAERILKQRNWFKKGEMDEMHQCAAFGLGVLGSDAAKNVLKRYEEKGSKPIRLYCNKELRRSNGGNA